MRVGLRADQVPLPIYAKRIHGIWTDKITEAVSAKAQSMLETMGATSITPIYRGKPDSRYQK